MTRQLIGEPTYIDHDASGHCCTPVTTERCCQHWHYPVVVHVYTACQTDGEAEDACACAAMIEEPDVAGMTVRQTT